MRHATACHVFGVLAISVFACDAILAAPPAEAMNVSVDWTQVPALAIPGDEGVWEYRPGDPVPAVAERTVPLPPKRDFFEKINGSAINPAAM